MGKRSEASSRFVHGCGQVVCMPGTVLGGSGWVRNVILPREVHYRSGDRPQQSGSRDVALEFTTGPYLDQRQHAIPRYGGAVGPEGMRE